jgi:Caspase domain
MNRALIVGINDYGNPKLDLSGAVNDAKSIEHLLRENGDGSPNFPNPVLKENIKSKAELAGLLVDLFKHESEIALFYFAGHGNADYFGYQLVAPDGKVHDMGLPMSQLMTIVRNSPATNKIIILDCCHAAGMEGPDTTVGMGTYLHEGVTVLASSKHSQRAYEIDGHGVFTSLLIQAMEGGAADLNGYITAAGIYSFIDKAMGKGKQRPVFKTNISEFVPIRTVVPPVSSIIMQQLPVLFPDATDSFSLDPSFEDTNDPTVEHNYIIPYANTENIKKFKQLQKMQSVGLVEPVDAPFMYFAAMNCKSCKLTPLGQHYWRLAKEGKL